VDSLTDQEIALIAGKLDQLPAKAGGDPNTVWFAALWPVFLIAAGITIIIMLIFWAVGEALE
jgi:hypothetical protein